MGPVNLMESLYFSKMVPNYRLSKVFLSCYHIFSDYSMPLQKKKKTKTQTDTEKEKMREIFTLGFRFHGHFQGMFAIYGRFFISSVCSSVQ